MKTATLIRTEGEIVDIKPLNKKSFTLEEMQAFVGGNIEIITLPSGKVLVVNEEGKLNGLPKNEHATEIWKEEYPIEKYPHNNDSLVVGDVLISDPSFVR